MSEKFVERVQLEDEQVANIAGGMIFYSRKQGRTPYLYSSSDRSNKFSFDLADLETIDGLLQRDYAGKSDAECIELLLAQNLIHPYS